MSIIKIENKSIVLYHEVSTFLNKNYLKRLYNINYTL